MKSIVIVLIIIGIISALGCMESPEYSDSGSVSTGSEIEILEHHMETGDYGIINVVGQAKNTGSKSLSYAEIRVKFYDANDGLLDSSIDNINDLGAGETWNFKVMYLGLDDEKVDSYKIAAGTTI